MLADDHPTILAGLEALLRGLARVEVAGIAADGDALIRLLQRQHCDAVITDYAMPGSQHGDGLTLLGFLRRRWPSLVVILHTMQEFPTILTQARQLGIRHMVSKADAGGHIGAALQSAMVGGEYFSPAISAILRSAPGQDTLLTPREREIVRLFASGMSMTAIAKQVHRSKQTVSTQKRSAMQKLGVEHDAGLLRAWQDHHA